MRHARDGVRIREDVVGLPVWDPTLLLYAKAVGRMRERPITDPLSWRFQAAVHGYREDMDPYFDPAEEQPDAAEQRAFWNQCQHNSWFFLPWHRGYLAVFEQIVRAHLFDEPDADHWALPYWNYSAADPAARLVRAEFREPFLPNGDPNPLAMAARGDDADEAQHGAETGDFGVTDRAVALSCLRAETFDAKPFSGVLTFGGPQGGFSHNDPAPVGALEATPHGAIHVAVGGFMGEFETAALDPLFWVHHANVDRLWEVWLGRDSRFRNPAATAWKSKIGFRLRDASGSEKVFTAGETVDTKAEWLGYVYEDTTDPLRSAMLGEERVAMSGDAKSAERVGASERGVPLGAGATAGSVRIDDRAVRGAALADDGERRVYLNLEHIKGSDGSVNYEVFVNPEDPGAPEEDSYAGLLTTFGLAQASQGAALSGGNGLTQVLDITDLVARLKALGRWNGKDVTVSFVPKRRTPRADDLRVGQISIYYR